MNKIPSNHEEFPYIDKDLSDHGAIPYDRSLSGYARDLPDVDLSDHGAVPYDRSLSGYARDLPDVDLSDHGAVPYEPKSVTWGTNDEEIIKQINILMHASYSDTVAQIIPLLNAASLAKIIEYRYRKIANTLEVNKAGLSMDEKARIGTELYMDFLIIDNMILSNPNCLQPIFNPSLYVGQEELTDIFGVIEKYQQDLENIGVQIPLINASKQKPLMDAKGRIITAQEILNFLMSKSQIYKQENSDNKKL